MSLVTQPPCAPALKLERIILQVVPDASTRRIVLERGDVDFAVQMPPRHPGFTPGSGVTVTSYPSSRGWWFRDDVAQGPFTISISRRALAWAMPYETLPAGGHPGTGRAPAQLCAEQY